MNKILLYAAIIAAGIAAPFAFPAYTTQFSYLWVMIVLALTWDMQGGQMGYNSLGNIFFFGAGMYVSAVIQVGLWHPVGEYTYAAGINFFEFSQSQYTIGLVAGIAAAGVLCALFAYGLNAIIADLFGSLVALGVFAAVTAAGMIFGVWDGMGGGLAVVWLLAFFGLGNVLFGLRGPYFAIGTLGLAIAAGELVGTWQWVGAGSGISMPPFPAGDPGTAKFTFYFLNFALVIATFATLAWLYSTRFGLAINAIRDDEEKAEGMGLHTGRYKRVNWAIAAFFIGISGAIFGNIVGFIEPLEVAFQTVNFGIFMVIMALLGGKGTLWGPVIGATVFHVFKEVTWTYLLGWQWVALGGMIVVIVVYFQEGLMGWMMRMWPERFGIRVEAREETAQ